MRWPLKESADGAFQLMSMDVRVTAPFFKSFGDSDGAERETVKTVNPGQN